VSWLDHITVEEGGKVMYRGREIELTCENVVNIAAQSKSGYTDACLMESLREIKLEILLSKR